MNDIERYNFWNLETSNFGKCLWDEFNSKRGEELGLVFLYESLNNQLKKPKNGELFISYILDKDLTSNIIVHTLNALSPIKNELPSWKLFVDKCYSTLINREGLELADQLMKVVIV